jgi:ketosteroid isomerase-like protein
MDLSICWGDTAQAMSQENVDLVWRAWEVFSAGVADGNFAAPFDAGLYAPDATLVPTQEATGAKTYVGREGFVDWLRAWIEDFRDWRMWPEQIIDAGHDRVVALARQTAIGKASGVPVEQRFGVVLTLRSGQVIEQRHYIDPADTLEAVGLSEQDAHADS